MLVLCMHKQKSHKWSRNSCAQLVWFIYLLNETTGPKMTCIAHVPSTLHFLKDWKFELDHLQGEGRNYLLMEKTGCCLFLLHKLCPGSLTSVPTWLCFHHWPHTCSLIRRDGERGPRCQPSFALQAVPEMQLAVIQLGSAEGCRLLDETPGQWQLSLSIVRRIRAVLTAASALCPWLEADWVEERSQEIWELHLKSCSTLLKSLISATQPVCGWIIRGKTQHKLGIRFLCPS